MDISYKKRIVDLGCGNRKLKREDAEVIGVDIVPGTNADIIFDLNKFPYTFEDSQFDEIIMTDVIEHLNDIKSVMTEIHRIAKSNAIVRIRTPHYSSHYAYNDPTHVHYFGYFAFDSFAQEDNDYSFYSSVKFTYSHREIKFPKVWIILGCSYLANKFPKRWEQLFAFIFRAENLVIDLKVIK